VNFFPSRPEEDLHVETNYQILFEDAFFLIADKPAPLPVHKVGAFKNKNLLSLLLQKTPYEFLAPVNRLDSETSGLVLFAKTSKAAGKLGLQFENRLVEKEYLAIVTGRPSPESGLFTQALGLDESRGHRQRVLDPQGETAETRYELIEHRAGYSLMRIFPKTGRTHQIRAHFAFAGHPLVGDKIYIEDRVFKSYTQEGWKDWMKDIVKWPRLALHAAGLKIRHPESGQEMRFASALPASLTKFWENPV
jgi:RluA family pseudouridine synthase